MMKPSDEKPDEGISYFKLSSDLAAHERVGPGPPARRLPPRRRSRVITFVVCYAIIMAVFSVAAIRTDSGTPLIGIGIILAATFAYLYHCRRCPCGGRLVPREVPIPEVTGRSRLFFDCARCRTVWDPDEIVYHASD